MISGLVAKINNKSGFSVRVPNGNPTISWSFDEIDFIIPDFNGEILSSGFIEQTTYHIMVGTSSIGLGATSFNANLLNTGEILSTARQFTYNGPALSRGTQYYGQVRVEDDLGNRSSWASFSFKYNSLPIVLDVEIEPSEPSLNDNISLSYTYIDTDGDMEDGTQIRWFKDGKHEREYDGFVLIPSSELGYGQTWFVEIVPADGLEYGPKSVSSKVSILTEPPVASDVRILPQKATVNDILKADHKLVSDTGNSENVIRWFINESHQDNVDNKEFVRLKLNVGDLVRFEITPFDGVTFGQTVSSPLIEIQSSNFIVKNIMIEGSTNPLSLLTTRPTFTWDIISPYNRSQEYVSIMVGTAPGANNIFSEIINTTSNVFQLPANLLGRGRDYFVSIAVNDEPIFEAYSIAHFRLTGSRWTETVSNDTGWTVEAQMSIFGNIEPATEEEEIEETEDTTVAKATVISINEETGAITQVDITSGGKNYVSPPTITVSDAKDNGQGAVLEAKIDSTAGKVTGVIIKNGGTGFLSVDDIVVSFEGGQETTDESSTTDKSTTTDEPTTTDETTDETTDSAEEVKELPDELRFQVIRFQDGKRFGEVRIFKDKLAFLSEELIEIKDVELLGNFSIRIHGQGDDVQVFLNKKLIIDATGLFTQKSTSKRLDIGAINGEVFDIRYRTVFYTTSGDFDTDNIDEYGMPNPFSDMQFHIFADFKDSRAVSIKDFLVGVSDFKVVGVNPSNEEKGGSLFSIGPNKAKRFPTANRTFTPINKIMISENNKFVGIAHARGATLFSNYPLINFDHMLVLIGEEKKLPDQSGWELYQNIGKNVAYFDDFGFIIDTSFENIGMTNG